MRLLRSGRFRLALATVVPLAVFILLSVVFWDWLNAGESGSTTIRNIGLVIAGLVALPLAVWRSLVAERQAGAAQRQADAAQQSLLNERYQRGAEMLGNEVLSVRIGGVYALQRLAEEHPEQYHIQIIRLFCSFVRHPTKDEGIKARSGTEEAPRLREDVQAVMAAIGSRQMRQLELEWDANFKLDLRYADLSSLWLEDANLSEAKLWDVNLCGAMPFRANLSGAELWYANLSRAALDDTNLSGTEFSTGYGEAPATGLTQAQLNVARTDPDNPPKLDGVVDAETGELLVWRGKPLSE